MRWVLGLVLVALLAASCEVQVRERFRSESGNSSTTTTDVLDAVNGAANTSTSTTIAGDVGRGVSIPEEAVESAVQLILSDRDVSMTATLEWSQASSTEAFEVTYASDVRLELRLLVNSELERLGIVTEESPADPRVRWYVVSGTVRHSITNSECVPTGETESCEIAGLTDGDLTGLASREDDVVNLALRWQTRGLSGSSVPSIGVEVRDAFGRVAVADHEFVKAALEATRFVGGRGTPVGIGADAGRSLAARGGAGRLIVVNRR